MYTRGTNHYTAAPLPYVPQMQREGHVRVKTINGITQTWAVSRPLNSPHPNGAPFYIDDGYCQYEMVRGGQFAISPARPRVEADLTDPSTWQRKYVLTGA